MPGKYLLFFFDREENRLNFFDCMVQTQPVSLASSTFTAWDRVSGERLS